MPVGIGRRVAGHTIITFAISDLLIILFDPFAAKQQAQATVADPAARWTAAHGGQAFFAHATNYLIDTDHAIIVMSRPPRQSSRPKFLLQVYD